MCTCTCKHECVVCVQACTYTLGCGCMCVHMCAHACVCVHTHPYTTRVSLLRVPISCEGVYLPSRLKTSCDRTTSSPEPLEQGRCWAEAQPPSCPAVSLWGGATGSPTQTSCWTSHREGPAKMSQSCSSEQGCSAWALVPSGGDHPWCGASCAAQGGEQHPWWPPTTAKMHRPGRLCCASLLGKCCRCSPERPF